MAFHGHLFRSQCKTFEALIIVVFYHPTLQNEVANTRIPGVGGDTEALQLVHSATNTRTTLP